MSRYIFTTQTRDLYPLSEPFDSGWLDVGDGHEIYYEQVSYICSKFNIND